MLRPGGGGGRAGSSVIVWAEALRLTFGGEADVIAATRDKYSES